MNPEQKQQISQKISEGLLFASGIFFILFPLVFSTATTDSVILPKQIFVAFFVLLSLLALGVKILLDGQVRIKRTPLDVPILLFGLALILSSIFSIDRADSLIATGSFIFVLLGYFVSTNGIKTKNATFFLLSSLLTGGVLSGLISLLAHFKIYVLPFAATRVPTFNTVGTYLDLTIYLVLLLPIALSFVLPILKQQFTARVGVFSVSSILLLIGLGFGLILLFTTQKPVILPFDTGFQTAFAAISQDSGRMLQGFFFGSGYGNFFSVFTRFHSGSFNTNQQLWFLTFSSSSSLILELLATTGLVGVLSYLFLLFRSLTPMKNRYKNPFYLSLIMVAILSFVLPLSYPVLALFIFLLGGFSLYQKEIAPHEYFDIELKFVALKKGVLAFTTLENAERSNREGHPTGIIAFVLLLAIILVLGYYGATYALSDFTFQQSLSAANTNNGTVTYRLQSQAITTFPYRSAYYRIFSQTNIALANSLLSLQAGKSSPSAQVQQTALTLVQQAITTARQATTLSPQSVAEWQNLSSVYRTLIGLGQNADQFAIAAAQQAVVLDPSNPQEYVTLGGLYFQLQQYDNAIHAFQQAIALKSDYSNAYYNLGHSYEQKGDLQNALAQYQIVQQLVTNDKQNSQKIAAEIQALQAKIGSGGQQQTPKTTSTGNSQQQLSLPQQNTLPSQSQQIPLVSPTPGK